MDEEKFKFIIREELKKFLLSEFDDSGKRITIDYDELPIGDNQDGLINRIETYLGNLNSEYRIENDTDNRNLYIYLEKDLANWKIKQRFINNLERHYYTINRAYSIGTTTPEKRFEKFNEGIEKALKNNSEVEYKSNRSRNEGEVFRFDIDGYEFELYTYEHPSPHVEVFDPTSQYHPLTDDENEIFSSIDLGEEDPRRIVSKMIYYLRGYLEDEAIEKLKKNYRMN